MSSPVMPKSAPLLKLSEFVPVLQKSVTRFTQHAPNPAQLACVNQALDTPLMIVAGPGSGKTTVLVLRALRMVFVDGLLPEQVLLTTFTRKAAGELRARLIEWGLAIRVHLLNTLRGGQRDRVEQLDINRFPTGTLDSICEEQLTALRAPATPAPVLLEGFVANTILRNRGYRSKSSQETALDQFLAAYTFEGDPPRNSGERISVGRTLVDRLVHDRVDLKSFAAGQPNPQGRQLLVGWFQNYRGALNVSNQLDFAALEERFLEKLSAGDLARFTQNISAVLVDEYQDTNPLQESIYFELVRRASPSFTIVGDDDQSLYRFRGATVELFRDFVSRFAKAIPASKPVKQQHLSQNYRSTPEVTAFFNAVAHNDPAFAAARVQPPKPNIVATLPSNGIPVLGMFRPDVDTLARDLATLLRNAFGPNGHVLTTVPGRPVLRKDPNGGDYGDAVFLAHSVNELGRAMFNNPPKQRLPFRLREELAGGNVNVFNPRGRALRDIPLVQRLMGAMLDCIDAPTATAPMGPIQEAITPSFRSQTRQMLPAWRQASRAFCGTNPQPNKPHSLKVFIEKWGLRKLQSNSMPEWPEEWPLLELCFKLLSWFPELHDDPEGQVYLEAITRCITQASTIASYRSQVLHNQGEHDRKSVEAILRNVMVPLAEGDLDVDEDIMPSVPRNRLQFMTIHQAKGLEFPLVIVDVASDYSTNSPKNRFRRFPEQPGNQQRLEDDFAQYCEVGPLRLQRSALERSFDDLIRLYYVAYSRPQSVLLLVGVDKCLQYRTSIRHVATFWRMDGSWPWVGPHSGKKPPAQANQIPIALI